MEQQKAIEDLKSQLREAASEKDRAIFKSTGLQEDHQRMQLALERKSGETNQAVAEKVQLETMLKSKDQMMDTLQRQISQLREDLKAKDLEVETAIRRRHEEERQRERFDQSENAKLVNDLEYVKKSKNEMEAELRSEVQRYRGDSEVAGRKLRTATEELHTVAMKLKQTQGELESAQRKIASQITDGSSNAVEKLIRTESELLTIQRTKEQLEHQLQNQVDDLDTFKRQYDEQLKIWEREKAEAERRIQELVVANDKLRFENSEAVEAYKRKYADYKGKLRRANAVIQTLTTRVAKYEL